MIVSHAPSSSLVTLEQAVKPLQHSTMAMEPTAAQIQQMPALPKPYFGSARRLSPFYEGTLLVRLLQQQRAKDPIAVAVDLDDTLHVNGFEEEALAFMKDATAHHIPVVPVTGASHTDLTGADPGKARATFTNAQRAGVPCAALLSNVGTHQYVINSDGELVENQAFQAYIQQEKRFDNAQIFQGAQAALASTSDELQLGLVRQPHNDPDNGGNFDPADTNKVSFYFYLDERTYQDKERVNAICRQIQERLKSVLPPGKDYKVLFAEEIHHNSHVSGGEADPNDPDPRWKMCLDILPVEKSESLNRLFSDIAPVATGTVWSLRGGDSLNDMLLLREVNNPGLFVAVGNRKEHFDHELRKMIGSEDLVPARDLPLPEQFESIKGHLYYMKGEDGPNKKKLVFIPPLVTQARVRQLSAMSASSRRAQPDYAYVGPNALKTGLQVLQALQEQGFAYQFTA